MSPKRVLPIGGGAVAIVIAVVVALTVAGRDDEPDEPQHAEAVAVAEEYLDAFAAADVEALCETYSAESQQATFAPYDVDNCADYGVAFIRDSTSSYRVTEQTETVFDIGEATGDEEKVEVAFTAELTYVGDDEAAAAFYEANPTVTGAVVVVRDGEKWKVDAEATQESF